MKRAILCVLLCLGCARRAVVRQLDSCQATEVTVEGQAWRVSCVNQWKLRHEVIFHKQIQPGDLILYVPYKENELGELHGYIDSINGQKD